MIEGALIAIAVIAFFLGVLAGVIFEPATQWLQGLCDLDLERRRHEAKIKRGELND